MNAQQDIEKFLGQWLELTEAEAGAIQSSKWGKVREIQTGKAALQRSLTAARERWLAENLGMLAPAAEHPLRMEVARLVSLENRNADLLTAQMRRAQAEKESRAEALRNLRRLERSYGRRMDKAWETYS
jgi:hypothetical protein